MPTAVERLVDSFLKFAGLRDQGALHEATLKIDEAFLKLSTANADDFLKIESHGFLKFEFEKIGDSFIKLGSDFQKVSVGAELVDQVVLKLTGSPTGDSTDARGPQADFVALDHKLNTTSLDLKILGADFLKLDTSANAAEFQQKGNVVADDFMKLGADMAADQAAFLKLGADFIKLGGNSDSSSPLDRAYKELGGELQAVGDAFGVLATDFVRVGDAVAHGSGGGGGAGRPGDGGQGGGGSGDPIGAALTLLYQDFHALDLKLDAAGDGSVRLIRDLLPSAGDDGLRLFGDNSSHGNGHG
jgi:hypothetical protein